MSLTSGGIEYTAPAVGLSETLYQVPLRDSIFSANTFQGSPDRHDRRCVRLGLETDSSFLPLLA
jgi:hypothetical protein